MKSQSTKNKNQINSNIKKQKFKQENYKKQINSNIKKTKISNLKPQNSKKFKYQKFKKIKRKWHLL
jgi:hypothetical protein